MEKKYAKDYTPQEMMVVASARELRDKDRIFVGIGLPSLACVLAQRTFAPNLTLIYESGVINARPARLPISIGDPALVSGSAEILSFFETFSYVLQRGFIDVGFLGGAQIDKYGNINSTVIQDYEKPKVRLPGSGGACEIAALAERIIVIAPHEKRRLVEKVDFITSPGFLVGSDSREKAGLPGKGPSAVITTMGVLRYDSKTKEMYLDSIHPGTTVERVKENTGWDLKLSPTLKETEPPSERDVSLLRTEIDPQGIFLKREVA